MRRLIIVFFLINATHYLFAQKSEDVYGADSSTTTASNASRPAYLDITYGISYSSFRDFATSPLFYVGNPHYIAVSHIDVDSKRESSFRLSYSFGNFNHSAAQNEAVSTVNSIAVNYLELFEFRKISSSKFNLKLGGQLNSTANLRDNAVLGNNSDGFEVISTLFGAVKGTLDMSGKQGKRKRNLACGLNIGLINSSYRNGFIYTRQSPLLNRDHINDGYEFRFFSGYRINSTVAYTAWLQNGNAIQLSYVWDIYQTGGNQDQLEMAAHLLTLSILFNLK